MGVAKRKFPRGYKALLHFDYPYFAEPGDGLRDEIGVLEWSANNPNYTDVDVKLVGTEIPVAENVAGTPKFGYRCLQVGGYSSFIGAEKYDYFNIDSTKTYEFEFFIRLTAFGHTFTWPDSDVVYDEIVTIFTQGGYAAFNILVGTSGEIIVKSVPLGIDATSARNLVLNTWTHLRVRIDNGTFKIFFNGESVYNGTCSGNVTDTRDIRLGGFTGQIDEFLFRQVYNGDVYDSVPAVPYKGYIDTYGIGGTGKQGALNLTSGTSRLNTVQGFSFQDASTIVTATPTGEELGIHGMYSAGDEVMLVKNQTTATKPDNIEAGLYCFRKIKSITGLTITLDKPVTEFSLNETDGDTSYRFKIHLVPNYTSVTIGANATVIPRATADGTGGLVVFRCKGDVNIQGKILTSSYGMLRQDYFQMTHNHLPERFITARGGGVIILSEGTVTAGDNARIGASWSGAGKAGARVSTNGKQNLSGNPSGSGYGGSGGARNNGSINVTSGMGGVGGGGSGCSTWSDSGSTGNGKDAGFNGYTGACYTGGTSGNALGGGIQGVQYPNYASLAGGGALQSQISWSDYAMPGYAGSCVMIICKTLKVSMNAISTGGGGAIANGGSNANGGGGCGMCYLAYEEAE